MSWKPSRVHGHVQIQNPEWREERAVILRGPPAETRHAIEEIPGVTRVSPRIVAGALTASGEKSDTPAEAEPGVIAGLDIALESGPGGLLEGLDPSRWPGSGEVVVGTVLANRLRLHEGQLIAVIGQDVDGFPSANFTP